MALSHFQGGTVKKSTLYIHTNLSNLFLSQYILLSLSGGGCKSLAFPFQRVNKLYLQDKNTNTYPNLSNLFLSQDILLSHRGSLQLSCFPFSKIKYKYEKWVRIYIVTGLSCDNSKLKSSKFTCIKKFEIHLHQEV